MRKRFTIKPIGAESSHPKFAGVNNAWLFFFFFSFPRDFISTSLPLPTTFERRRVGRKVGQS